MNGTRVTGAGPSPFEVGGDDYEVGPQS